ncbi:MAG: hypothetical protein ACE5JO_04865 [Candidatus Binatia bacterium]
MPAREGWKKLGAPSAILLGIVIFFSFDTPLTSLIGWGIVAGFLGTLALDSIRIPGYLLGYMPLDLPLRFGTMMLDIDKKLKLKMMSRVLSYVNEEVEKGRDVMEVTGGSTGVPRLRVSEIRKLIGPALTTTAEENQVTIPRIRTLGYLWHYTNGISFGIAHAILFGRGSWLLTVAFGLLLATVFLSILRLLIPPMRPGLKLPAVVILAHLAVILVLGTVTQTFISPDAEQHSLLQILFTGLQI